MGYPKSITFIRHAKSVGNEARETGDTRIFEKSHNYEFEITEEGKMQAEKLRDSIRCLSFDAYYVSMFKRARQTAEIIRPDNKFIMTPLLNEQVIGAFHLYEPDKAQIVDPWNQEMFDRLGPYHHRGTYGESMADVECRIYQFLRELRDNHSSSERVLVVTHGHWLLGLKRIMLNKAPEDFADLKENHSYDNCSITVYSGFDNKLKLISDNSTDY